MSDLAQYISDEIEALTFKKVLTTTPLISSGLLDSITIVDLAVAIEEETNIKINFTDIKIENFDNIEMILEYLTNRKTATTI